MYHFTPNYTQKKKNKKTHKDKYIYSNPSIHTSIHIEKTICRQKHTMLLTCTYNKIKLFTHSHTYTHTDIKYTSMYTYLYRCTHTQIKTTSHTEIHALKKQNIHTKYISYIHADI